MIYNQLQKNSSLIEKLIISNHPLKGKSHELVIEYLNGDISSIKLNNKPMNVKLSVENWMAVHKILELGQNAFKGKPIP